MINKYIVLTIISFLIANILVWYQLNSQLVWEYIGFGNLWSVRFLGFAASMMTFPIMTYFYLGEAINVKTFISIILAFIIMLLQLL